MYKRLFSIDYTSRATKIFIFLLSKTVNKKILEQ